MEEEREDTNISPIEQVRLTVPITDDETLPALTFRTWVLGLSTLVILAFTRQFFHYRQNQMAIDPTCALIVIYTIGKLMERTIPAKLIRVPVPCMKWTFSLNPGPFNIKEHALISILANAGTDSPYASVIVYLMKAFFHQEIHPLAAFLIIQTTQLLGYGFAGMFLRFLVESPYMWWPEQLVNVAFFRALHEEEVRPKGTLTRLQFFLIAVLSSFAYYIIPNYFFPSITALSFVCWIWKDSVTAQQIGSGRQGLGLGSFAFDWATISGFLGSPIAYPMFAIINSMVGFVIIFYVITPIAYWTNSYDAKQFPIFTSNLFDAKGNIYNISKVLEEKNFKFNQEGYDSYSKVHLSIFYAYVQGFMFASVTASLTHVAFFNGRSIWNQLKEAYGSKKQSTDIHIQLMKKNYEPIPQWWFMAILISTLGLSIFTCVWFKTQIQLPYWGVLLACALVLIFIIPIGVIRATTNQGIALNLVAELIIGYLYPGKPLAMLTFKSYGIATMNHALYFLGDLKLGHYMKIPPRSMFITQVVGTIVSSSVNLGVVWWIFSTVDNICDLNKLPKGSPWTCPGAHVVYNLTNIWGVIGPSRIFAPNGIYSKMYYFFLIGAIAPILVWILSNIFPTKKWIRLINIPIMVGAVSAMPPITPVNYWSWFVTGVIFNYIVYKNYRGWWAKYAYVLSSGLDAGIAFMALLTSMALNLQNVYGISWWGLEVDDHCPLAKCPTAGGIQVDGCPVVH